jgi:hypothetical protein
MSELISVKLVVSASAWSESDEDGVRERVWSGPVDEDGAKPLAAKVERAKGSFWPFQKWQWFIWSPWGGDDEVAGGTASSLEGAMVAADSALREHVSVVERELLKAASASL